MQTRPQFHIGDTVMVLSPNLALWPPYEARISDMRYVAKSGWRYEVIEDDFDPRPVWVSETDLEPRSVTALVPA